jgi:hypothetical protein
MEWRFVLFSVLPLPLLTRFLFRPDMPASSLLLLPSSYSLLDQVNPPPTFTLRPPRPLFDLTSSLELDDLKTRLTNASEILSFLNRDTVDYLLSASPVARIWYYIDVTSLAGKLRKFCRLANVLLLETSRDYWFR